MADQQSGNHATRHVLIFGATSVVGGFLLPLLSDRNWLISAVSRCHQPELHCRYPGSEWLVGALPAGPVITDSATHVISLGPCDAFVAWLAQQSPNPHLAQVIAFGSTSAQTKLDSSSASERSLAHRLLASEAALERECERLGVRWTLLRPTLIYGGAHDLIARIGAFAARWHVYPFLLGPAGRARRQPVHAADLANAVNAAIDHEPAFDQRINLPGSEVLALSQLIARAAQARTRLALPLPIPFALGARLVSKLRGIVGGSGLNADAAARISRDQIFEISPAAQALGFKPRPFRP
jgi:uncharacterized protein YbjT (DUF2867 family)